MPMIGHGTRISADIKRGSTMPFSVQANHVFVSHQNQSATAGTNVDYSFNNLKWSDSSGEDRNPTPFGGKFLYHKCQPTRNLTKSGYFVPMLNGVEVEELKVSFSNPSQFDDHIATTEVPFEAGDYIGYRLKSTSGAIGFDDWVFMLVLGFDI